MDSPRGRIHLITQVLDGAPASGRRHAPGPLPGLHGLRDRLPIRGPVRPADRGGPRLAAGAPRRGGGVEASRARGGGVGQALRANCRAGPSPAGSTAGTARSPRDRAVRGRDLRDVPLPAPPPRPDRPAARRAADRPGPAGSAQRGHPLAPELAAALRLAPPAPARRGRSGTRPGRLPARMPAAAPRRAVVGMLTGCVQQVFFPQVNAATARVLAAEGCDVIIPRGQGCCGALSLHGGRAAEAARFARADHRRRSSAPASTRSWSTRRAAARP